MRTRRSAGAVLTALALAGGLLAAGTTTAAARPEAFPQRAEVSADSYIWKNVRDRR